jgi:KaiC/GvpD/RAD55 family RecA-like ATPase
MLVFKLLRGWEITTVVTSEFPVTMDKANGGRLESLTDGIINLYYTRNENHRSRSLEIIKMRDTRHDDSINPFVISENGIEVKKGQ